MRALLEEKTFSEIRLHLNTMIATGDMSGDQIYETILELYRKGELSDEANDKAEDVLDALSGWCQPIYYIGSGNYGG